MENCCVGCITPSSLSLSLSLHNLSLLPPLSNNCCVGAICNRLRVLSLTLLSLALILLFSTYTVDCCFYDVVSLSALLSLSLSLSIALPLSVVIDALARLAIGYPSCLLAR